MDLALFIGQQAIAMAVPLWLAGAGELISERAGTVNIGIEGLMLIGAFVGWAVAVITGSAWAGAFAAMWAGAVIAAVFAIVVHGFRGDQIVAGLAVYLFAMGFTGVCYTRAVEAGYTSGRVFFEPLASESLAGIPIVGRWLFSADGVLHQYGLFYVTLVVLLACHVYLKHTRWGLELRAVGENPRAADALGIHVNLRRACAVMFGGACAGLAGAYLTIMFTHQFVENVTAGIGFLALAIVIFGRWQPLGLLIAGLLFGVLKALAVQAGDGMWSLPVPRQVPEMMPYVATIVLLAVLRKRTDAPEALGTAFVR